MTCGVPTTKGEFQLGNKRYCYPLTVIDYPSRYLLLCEAMDSTRGQPAFLAFERFVSGTRFAPGDSFRQWSALRFTQRTLQSLQTVVSFMNYGLGYIDLEEKTLQPLENPFGAKV